MKKLVLALSLSAAFISGTLIIPQYASADHQADFAAIINGLNTYGQFQSTIINGLVQVIIDTNAALQAQIDALPLPNSVGSNAIIDESLGSVDIADGGIQGNDIQPGVVLTGPHGSLDVGCDPNFAACLEGTDPSLGFLNGPTQVGGLHRFDATNEMFLATRDPTCTDGNCAGVATLGLRPGLLNWQNFDGLGNPLGGTASFNGNLDVEGAINGPTIEEFKQILIGGGDPDNDGVFGLLDGCPFHPEIYNLNQDDDGCPDLNLPKVKELVVSEPNEVTIHLPHFLGSQVISGTLQGDLTVLIEEGLLQPTRARFSVNTLAMTIPSQTVLLDLDHDGTPEPHDTGEIELNLTTMPGISPFGYLDLNTMSMSLPIILEVDFPLLAALGESPFKVHVSTNGYYDYSNGIFADTGVGVVSQGSFSGSIIVAKWGADHSNEIKCATTPSVLPAIGEVCTTNGAACKTCGDAGTCQTKTDIVFGRTQQFCACQKP